MYGQYMCPQQYARSPRLRGTQQETIQHIPGLKDQMVKILHARIESEINSSTHFWLKRFSKAALLSPQTAFNFSNLNK